MILMATSGFLPSHFKFCLYLTIFCHWFQGLKLTSQSDNTLDLYLTFRDADANADVLGGIFTPRWLGHKRQQNQERREFGQAAPLSFVSNFLIIN